MGLREGTLVDRDFVTAYFTTIESYGRVVYSYALGQERLPSELERYLAMLNE